MFQAGTRNFSGGGDVNEDSAAAMIKWQAPKNPNELIVNYNVRLRHNPDGDDISTDSTSW